MWVVIVEGDRAVSGVNLGHPIVTNRYFATRLFPDYFVHDLSLRVCCLAGTGPGQTVGLNLQTWLYIGGVDWTAVRVSPSVGVSVGFVGCVAEVCLDFFTLLPIVLIGNMSP